MESVPVTTDADLCARAFVAMLRLLVREMPGMYERPGGPGVAGLVSGMPLATLNGVFTEVTQPSITDVSAAAAAMAGLGVPWCIQFRGEPDPEAEQLARKYGLTGRDVLPVMLHRTAPGQPVRPASESAASRVRVVGLEDRSRFAAALAAGFEAPLEVMAPFTTPEFFALPGAVPYAAEEDGKIVAVGLGIFLGETAGIFNIATVPAYRGRGYGRAVTWRIVTDGIERGAPLAFLQSSAAGYPLYQSMGFRTVERWTYLLPAG
jgi:ribosomal protein S18 acetylase RimI-like enzyme